MRDPVDVCAGVEPHIRRYAGEEHVLWAAQLGDGNSLPLQIADGAHTVGPDYLETADVAPGENDDGVPCLHPGEERPDEVQGDVDRAGSHGWREEIPSHHDVL